MTGERPNTRRISQSSSARGLVIRGEVADTPLAETLQLILSLRKTGQLALERGEPREPAAIYVEDGDVVHAWCPPHAGSECFHRLLAWREGRYVFIADARSPEHTITVSGQALLLDGLRRLDELAQWAARLPPRGAVLWRCRDRGSAPAPRLTLAHWRLLRRLDGRTTIGAILDADPAAAEPLAELVRLGLTATVPDHGLLGRIALAQTVRGARQLESRSADLAMRLLLACNGVRTLAECCDQLGADPEEAIRAARYLLDLGLATVARGRDAAEALD